MKLLSIEVKKSSTIQKDSSKTTPCLVTGFLLKNQKTSDGATKKPKPPQLIVHANYKQERTLLQQLHDSEELALRAGAMCFVRYSSPGKPHNIHNLLVNVGIAKKGLDALNGGERLRRLGAMIVQKLAAERIASAVIQLDSFLLEDAGLSLPYEEAAQAFSEGAMLASYKFKKYFSKQENGGNTPRTFVLAPSEGDYEECKRGVASAQIMAEAVAVCRNLGNEPSNELYPAALAREAQALSRKYRIKCTVFNEQALKREKMGLLLGVGQGSVNPPRFIVMEYVPSKRTKGMKTLALVGKGVTFDSGGISIKPSARMEDMKHDMCGSAAVIGAILAIARSKLPLRVLCVVAAAENMPDGKAIQPGNILRSRSGKTVEINNTDAEGRLVLADALDWTQDKNPDYIIDAATLTGAISIALGKVCGGLMGNDDKLNSLVSRASELSGERLWELPLYEEYFDDLKSEYADMRNSGDTSYAGVMRGGMFLKQFIRNKTKWVHIDLANVAYDSGGLPYCSRKGSSGYGVRLFTEVAKLIAHGEDE